MAPTRERLLAGARRLGRVSGTLRVSPAAIAIGQEVTITWDVDDPAGEERLLRRLSSSLGLRRDLGDHGTVHDRPFGDVNYSLAAISGAASKPLASAHVSVDTSRCIAVVEPAESVQEEVISGIKARYGGSGTIVNGRRVWLRETPGVAFTSSGIELKLRLKAEVDNAPNIYVDIDAVIVLRTENEKPVVAFRRFSLDLNAPGWVDFLTGGISIGLEEWFESDFVPGAKQDIHDKFVEQLTEKLEELDDYVLQRMTVTEEGIELTVCIPA